LVILGISCWYHDSAAALLSDGKIVGAAAEERFSRKKHDYGFPTQAVEWVMEQGNVKPADIDHVVFYEKPLVKFERILASYISTAPKSFAAYITAMPLWLRQKLWFARELRQQAGYTGSVLYCDHHLSHAAGAYLLSPFDDAAVVTLDGVGEWASTTMGVGEGCHVRLDREIRFPHSLGLFYSAVTAHLGFKVNNDEYKVMGLASYGDPARFRNEMRELLHLHDDGSFELDMRCFAYQYGLAMLSSKGKQLLGPSREPESEIDQRHCDMSASLQERLEEAVVAFARAAHATTGKSRLCMGGGVALNCVANGRILADTDFEDLWIQPATGDDGGSLGAAVWVWNEVLGHNERITLDHAYLGPGYSEQEIRATVAAKGVKFQELAWEDVPRLAARLVHENRIVGWFQGRMEWGPRALGARSILANACNPAMKDILNDRVKHREDFRPFAPVVPVENMTEYFDLPIESPYMLLIGDVKPDKRDVIPAVTHTDGTARPQSVRRETNPLYYDVMREFERITGVPVIINTSFNVRGEPIVCTPEHAYRCFAGTGIDDLVIGRCWIRKEDIEDGSAHQ
jgi:carbamoyltransferase